mgnify:CR=1 FL=1
MPRADIPASAAALGLKGPPHVLVTGHPDERDRQIKLIEAPRFGIVGRDLTIRAEVMERGPMGEAGAFAQFYGADEPDGANLLLPLVKFVGPRDPRMLATLDEARALTGRDLPGPLPPTDIDDDPYRGLVEQGEA